MSTSIENLRRLAERDVKDHTALFDLYVTVGRDIDYLSIKFGIAPDDLIDLLEGYGEKLRVTAEEVASNPRLAEAILEDRATAKAIEEFGLALDYSGKGRLKKLSRLLVEEYVERFYPGIASEHPENDWICIEAYLDRMHPGWRGQLGEGAAPAAPLGEAGSVGAGGSGGGTGAGVGGVGAGAGGSGAGGAGAEADGAGGSNAAAAGEQVQGKVRSSKPKRKVRNNFRLY